MCMLKSKHLKFHEEYFTLNQSVDLKPDQRMTFMQMLGVLREALDVPSHPCLLNAVHHMSELMKFPAFTEDETSIALSQQVSCLCEVMDVEVEDEEGDGGRLREAPGASKSVESSSKTPQAAWQSQRATCARILLMFSPC